LPERGVQLIFRFIVRASIKGEAQQASDLSRIPEAAVFPRAAVDEEYEYPDSGAGLRFTPSLPGMGRTDPNRKTHWSKHP
jgi:hypothetical protein